MNDWFKDNPNFDFKSIGIETSLFDNDLLSDNNPYSGMVKDIEPFEKIVINPIEAEEADEDE